MRYKAQDIDNERYYQLPKGLFTYAEYKELSITAKVIYSILKDRMNLSRRHGWVEGNGDIFLKFSQQEIGRLLNLNKSTISRTMEQLRKYGLIETVLDKQDLAYKIYICKINVPKSTTEISDAEEHLGIEGMDEFDGHAAYRMLDVYNRPIGPSPQDLAGNRPVAPVQPPVADEEVGVAPVQPEVAVMQSEVAHTQPEVAPVQPEVAPVQQNETDLVRRSSETETNQKSETEDDDDDTRAGARETPPSELSEVMTYFADNVHPGKPIVPVEEEILGKFLTRFSKAWICEAIKLSISYGHPNLVYIHRILESWQEDGYQIPPVFMTRDSKRSAKKRPTKKGKSSIQDIYSGVQELYRDLGVQL